MDGLAGPGVPRIALVEQPVGLGEAGVDAGEVGVVEHSGRQAQVRVGLAHQPTSS
ncbi:hypothetical protein [Sinomonas atrocyanea]